MLSATRDMDAAQRFFRSAQSMTNDAPKQVTTDGHDSYPRVIREVLGPNVQHRCSAYLNRRIERDHRGVKQRYYPMLGFGALVSAQRFCRAFEEIRQYFRCRRKQMKSSHWPQPADSFYSEHSNWNRCSSQHNQPHPQLPAAGRIQFIYRPQF